ncbi:MAG: tetratricopeptide repeat protein [Kiritimatiellia bacterium]
MGCFVGPMAGQEIVGPAVGLRAAKAMLEDGMLELAERKTDAVLAALRKEPASSETIEEAATLMCRALYGQEKYASLLAFLERQEPWTEALQRSGAYHFWSALALHALGLSDQALARIAAFDRETTNSPYRSQMLRLRGRCHLAQGKLKDAAAAFKAFDAGFPEAPEAAENLLDYARVLRKLGQNEEAARILERLIARKEPYRVISSGRYLYGQLLLDTGRPAAAIPILLPVATNSFLDGEVRAEAWLAIASAEAAHTNLAGAVASAEEALVVAVSSDLKRTAGFVLGRLLLEQGKFEKAATVLRELIAGATADPRSESALMALADHLRNDGRYSDALREYQAYVETFTNQVGLARAYEGHGWCLMALDRPAEAGPSFVKAWTLATDAQQRERCLYKVADAQFAAGQYRAAAETYERFVRDFPESTHAAAATLQLAESLARAGDVQAAQPWLHKLVRECPDELVRGDALLRLARFAETAGRPSEALTFYNQVLGLSSNNPAFPAALRGRGMVRLRLFRFTEALEDFKRLAHDFPSSEAAEEAQYRQVVCYYSMGRDEEALATCRSFLERFPATQWTSDALFWLARFEFNRGEYRAAAEAFERFAELYPDRPQADDALLWAGLAASKQKDYTRSVELLHRLLVRYPTSPRKAEARFLQGETLCEQARFSEAILVFDEVIATSDDSDLLSRAWLRKGDAQFTLGADDPKRYQESIDCYRVVANSVNVRPDRILQAEYKIGRCYEKLGQSERALEQYYEKVILRYLLDREQGIIPNESAKMWFTRAAFNAASILEVKKDWRRLVAILERVVAADVPARKMAEEQIRKVKAEHWWSFGPGL